MINKNKLTGPANSKKTTRHHVRLSCAKSRKTNDAKSIKMAKNVNLEIFFKDFEVTYLQIANFSEK